MTTGWPKPKPKNKKNRARRSKSSSNALAENGNSRARKARNRFIQRIPKPNADFETGDLELRARAEELDEVSLDLLAGPAPDGGRLSDRQLAVVHRYFKNGFDKVEAFQTYVDASAYKDEKSAKQAAHRFFAHPSVRKELVKIREWMRVRLDLTPDTLLQELLAIAKATPADVFNYDEKGKPYVDLRELPPDTLAAIGEVTVDEIEGRRGTTIKTRVKMHSKLDAVDKLMSHLGMKVEKVELTADSDLAAALMAGRERARALVVEGEFEEIETTGE